MPRSTRVYKKVKNKGNRYYRTRPVQHNNEHVVNRPNSVENSGSDIQVIIDTPPSASKKKITSNHLENVEDNNGNINIVIDLGILCRVLCETLSCNLCGGKIIMYENADARNGLVCKLTIRCTNCQSEKTFQTSNKCINTDLFETNARLFYGLRCIGKGFNAGKVLCAMLNLPSPPTRYSKYTDIIGECVNSVATDSMKSATQEAVAVNEGNTDISIAFDGSWQKRGHVSKNGCATATSIDTGKVIDFEILTKYCQGCTIAGKNKDKVTAHKQVCTKNYEGSSGGMEVAAAMAIFHRSIQERGVRYINYLGDGDCKSFKAVLDSKPYDVAIKKLECVGHVKKRMGTRLRKLKRQLGSTPLSDGKPIKNAGRLTDPIITELQEYYGSAIRNNVHNGVEIMRRAVWATFFHRVSTDEKPSHQLCPPPPDTWCKYRKAEALGCLKEYKHKHSLPFAVMEAIKPVYRDLSNTDLLKKCLHGKTQNVNEGFNNIVWCRVPKNVFVGYKTLKLGVSDAVITWNDGNIGRVKVLRALGMKSGENTMHALQSLDKLRIQKAEAAALQMTKEARKKRRMANQIPDEEEADYLAGGF